MPEYRVVNASPVITLAKAGHLTLLEELAAGVLLLDAVASEVLAGPASDPAWRAIVQGWGTRIAVPHVPAVVLEWGLGAGESAVLAVALTQQACTAVLDDTQGRKCARALGVPVIGTVGVILRAAKAGRLVSALTVLQDLRKAGLYVDEAMIAPALKKTTGEAWQP